MVTVGSWGSFMQMRQCHVRVFDFDRSSCSEPSEATVGGVFSRESSMVLLWPVAKSALALASDNN